jgi:glycosyltransferase involved in cell wall biosynthesis
MLCQPNDPQEMANHIIEVLTNKQSNRNLSENGFNRYKQMFTADQMADAYFKLINS